ncbi:O-acetyltransferase OatA [Ferriphaselus amnicola]|uniref:O-acetyltransferase OatA n=1 Tax=Ferriphaselus amnicola TaxID=1188319 RepID=A0A2Z6GDL1_9PROT|nr:acyltransferase family protein [Ferriphaselus amnicola]BBE51638.1 O-acetyltransferase OatA [Ferriphaselus amnicola]
MTPPKHPHLAHPKYRPDIDGLRAIAILAVVIFHAFPGKMPGGFIGVDIFFVISGFLISTIIFSSLERNRFSLVEFYARRVRRIFPALILVLVSSLAFSWFVLFPDEYKQLGKHTAASSGFIQNLILWKESGYFDNSAETKPLLHLWSLAIEEQFYIFWPLLLAYVWKRHWSFLRITAVIAVLSFATNIYLVHRSPTSAFFLPLSRFWELMVGGVLAYVALHRPQLIERHKNTQSLLGFALILSGLLLLNKGRDFPGWWALLPTIGAFLIISAGPTTWLNEKLLTNKLMVWIGLISYPLYLWHWPILSYLRITNGDISAFEGLLALAVALSLAWLSYLLVEKPFRHGRDTRGKTIALLVVMLCVWTFGAGLYKQGGAPQRSLDNKGDYLSYFENSPPKQKYFATMEIPIKYRFDCDFYDIDKYRAGKSTQTPRVAVASSCYTRNSKYAHSVLIWGDSHAQQLYFGLEKNLPFDWQILMATSSGCAPHPSIAATSTTNYCEQSNWFAIKTISEVKPDVVIVAQAGGHSLASMEQIIKKLKNIGVNRIIFTGPVPHWKPDLPKVIARNLWINTPQRTWVGVDREFFALNDSLKANKFQKIRGVKFIDLMDFFCNKEGCLTYIGIDRKLGITTWDYGHLTPAASDLLAKSLLTNEVISP